MLTLLCDISIKDTLGVLCFLSTNGKIIAIYYQSGLDSSVAILGACYRIEEMVEAQDLM